MKRIVLMVAITTLLCGISHAGHIVGLPSEQIDPRKMTFPPAPFTPPRSERLILPNGITLYFMEDHELPLIHIDAMIRTGSIYDPPEKIGLAGITGVVMRTGGTKQHSGSEMDALLDQIAAGISVGVGMDAGAASLDVLTKDFDLGLILFAETLMHPVFDEEKFKVAIHHAIERVRRKNDHPAAIARREFGKLIYGADNPYGREVTEATLQAITRDDLIRFHQTYFVPNHLFLGITGDFNKKEMTRAIKNAFSGWEKRKTQFPPVAPVEERGGGVYQITRPLTQTQIRMGHLGIKRDNPDYHALLIMDDILGGGGFTSRLFRDIRTERGLAYSVGTFSHPGYFERGVIGLYAETRAETTYQAISLLMGHVQRIRSEPVPEEELMLAKESVVNSLIFSFSDPAHIVNRQMSFAYYGIVGETLDRYREQVEKVTQKDIQRVAEEYLRPDRMTIFAVGDDGRYDQPLSLLGEVRKIDLAP